MNIKPIAFIGTLVAAATFAGASLASQVSADTNTPPIEHIHLNDRLLDTRGQAKPGNGWSTTIQLDENIADPLDWTLNVQVVQADGDGWVEVDGRSAIVHDGGRANVEVSVSASDRLVPIRVHGSNTHIVIDLVEVVATTHPITGGVVEN